MLYPQENEVRGIIDLNGIWNFRLGSEEEPGDALDTSGWKWEPIAVPASFNDQKDVPDYRNHYGWVYYQRKVVLPAYVKNQRLMLRFDAVAHAAKIYIDGQLAGRHKGGFLPFEVEITDRVKPGKAFELTVAADNKINHGTLPVGNEGGIAFFGSDNPTVPSVKAAKQIRKKSNLPNFDFFNYTGLNRPVRIVVTPLSYLEDITLVPDIDGEDGIVYYEIRTGRADPQKGILQNADMPEEGLPESKSRKAEPQNQDLQDKDLQDEIRIEILDAEGRTVASAKGDSGKIWIPKANLWWPWPGTPYLYTARVTYGADVYEEKFGVRTVRVEGRQFLINNRPFYFKGFGKHEDSAFRGRGLDLCLDVKDVNLIHWLHANSFRTSHYPYAEELYQLCDREGIVIIDETPAVGIGAGESTDPYKTFPIREHHEQVLREMIARDKNHPCVVMWSMGNEPDTEHFPESAYEYWHSLYELTHRLDPTNRPVTFVCCQNNYERDLVTRTMDVVCINRYYGWYNLSGDLDAACYALNLELDFWEKQGKPVMMTEYGADCIAGIHECVPEMFSEEFQVEFYRRINAEFDKRKFITGEHAWNFADYATLQGCMRADGNRKGLFTRDRRPKMAAHYFKERWSGLPDFKD